MDKTTEIPTTPRGLSRPWVFEVFPALKQHLAWTPLVDAPTPVQPLAQISARLDREVWIKRDDKTSPLYGGNKARKLEFILGDALSQGRKTLVTGGGMGTNHGLATAIFGKKLNFRVMLGLFYQPVTDHVRKNLRLFRASGAEIHYVGSLLSAVLRYYVIERVRRPGAYFIPPGGSSPLGTLGYVDAGLELAMQVKNKALPLPRAIFVAVGTCSTMAGLVLGLKLAGLPTRVIGVQVAPRPFANPKTVLRLARKTLGVIQKYDRRVPKVALGPADVPIERRHYGPGYGVPTEAGRAAIKFMAENEGIPLELTYTGKAFGALLDTVKAERLGGPVLFWNTFNSVDLSAEADGVSFRSLPKEFHGFFQGDIME